MRRFRVEDRDHGGKRWDVTAEDFTDAVRVVAEDHYRGRFAVHRVTGTPGLSGVFAIYEPVRGGENKLSSAGYHVMETS